jgi:hypothetical protein
MREPKIDLGIVPGLDGGQGLFGSITRTSSVYDDRVVSVMVYVYDALPPGVMV